MQGPYVLVMVATGRHQNSNKLPAMWLISAYRSLSKPFRKNVRYIMLVRPTSGLKTLVAIIRPFVSSKAAKKVKKVCLCSLPLFEGSAFAMVGIAVAVNCRAEQKSALCCQKRMQGGHKDSCDQCVCAVMSHFAIGNADVVRLLLLGSLLVHILCD